jgi:transcriptional regulator with XRE-family HTH domain
MATRIDFGGEETLQAAVARRLRGLLAEIRMTKTEFAERVGWDRGYLYRRLSGETAMDVCNLETIEQTVRFRAEYLMFGHEPKIAPPRPPKGGGGSAPIPADESLLSGLNRRALAYLVAALPAASDRAA